MNMSKYLTILLMLIGVFQSQSQCLINELQVQATECNQEGKFFVTINFNHTGTSERFKVQGNGINYGLFQYSALPITIGPLNGDCTTNYEFVVRDVENQECTAFKNFGKKCCHSQCSIAFENVEIGECHGSNYPFSFNLAYDAPNNGFDLFNNGVHYGYYTYSQLPLHLPEFPSSNSETYNTVVVCANDNHLCCDTLLILNPCICTIYKVQGQVVDCNEEAGTFSLKLNFKHHLNSDSFQIGGNSVNYGKFAYTDLPITLHNLPFSNTIEYEFLIVDENDAFCFGSYELGIVNACNFECSITHIIAEKLACEEGKFYVDIDFDYKNTSLSGFIIRGNGVQYGSFEYGEPYYRIGPLEGDCETLYEFVVRDKEQEGCMAITHFTEPVCCEVQCEMAGLSITEFCEDNVLVAFDLNFEHTRTEGSFVLKINSQVIGTFTYASLPLKITNINFDLPNVVVKIFDKMDESCNLISEYEFECVKDPVCNIYDLNVKVSDCNDHGQFYAIMKFKVTNPKSDKFIVKVNGNAFDTLPYGKELYEIGPLEGDCATLYKFVIRDLISADCIEDFGFTEKICCQTECKISEPVISFSPCEEGKFDLTLNFNHISTVQKFRVKINGVVKGPFNYTDLPIIIENLSERHAYEIIIWDTEKEACRLTFTIPAIECTTGTQESSLNEVKLFSNNQQLNLILSDVWVPSTVTITDLTGNRWSVFESNTENSIDISALPAGLYLVQIQNRTDRLTKRFLKY